MALTGMVNSMKSHNFAPFLFKTLTCSSLASTRMTSRPPLASNAPMIVPNDPAPITAIFIFSSVMITLPSHKSALLFLFCRFRSAQRLRLTSSAQYAQVLFNKNPHPLAGQGFLLILPIQRSWLLHMDRRAGGVNPALPDFLGLFCPFS